MTELGLSAAEHAKLDSYMLDIASSVSGTAIAVGDTFRFGSSSGGLCVYKSGGYHDFRGGAREHGYGAFQLIQHLYPNEDAVTWARAWLARHPGAGAFTPGEGDEPADDHPEIEASAYIQRLYDGAVALADTSGYVYVTQTRGLPLRPEDQAQLRWVADYRGNEGALLAPVTDDDGKLVRLLVTHIAPDGCKSKHEPARIAIRGAKRLGLVRFGSPTTKAIETEGIEKGLAARAARAEYVIVSGGAANLGKVPLPPSVRNVVIARDADPAGSPADLALWRAVVHRLGQGLKVTVTTRPNDIAPKDAPPLKDLDDVYRYDPELVPILLNGANLDHGRLGDAVDTALLDAASRLDAVQSGRARKSIAVLLGTSLSGLDDKVAAIVKTRIEGATETKADAGPAPWDHPVTDIGAALDGAVKAMKQYVAAPDTHFDTVALWCLHTHLIHREELGVDVTPRLGFQSPEEDSGKSTFMKLVREQVPRPKGTGSISSSALFRAVDARKCTLLVDEADYAFRADANPDLLAIFNSGNERTFAVVTRSVPLGEGQFEDHDFNTFAAMCFTSIDKLSTKSMQSRCIALPMKPATKEEAAKLVRFRASRCAELKACNRKFMRWAADLPALPEVEIPENFVNRVADNWRSLLQIAHLAGKDWHARALAAAKADADGGGEEGVERGANGLLDAIWRIFNAGTMDPRRLHTSDLVRELMDVDDGRWRGANKGRAIDEYYLRAKLKGYVQPGAKGPEGETRHRQWRPPGSPIKKWGYHELHFRDAFLRYLGRGLPSETPPEPIGDEKDESPEPSFSLKHPSPSTPSTPEGLSPDISKIYAGADDGAGADGPSAPDDAVEEEVRTTHPHPHPPSAPSQVTGKSQANAFGADGSDGKGVNREKGEKGETNVTRFPRGPAGRRARKG